MKRIIIKVIPRSSRNEIAGKMADGTLKVKIKAPPVEGEANEALVKFLAKEWGVPRSKLTIVGGSSSRNKTIGVLD